MKKLILPIILAVSFLFLLPQNLYAQAEPDCRKTFDKESYKCLGVSGDCQRECSEETKRPDGGTYFNSGEIYSKCTKANDCDGKGRACNEQALANFRACGKSDKEAEVSEAKKETPKQDKNLLIQAVSDWLVDDTVDVVESGSSPLKLEVSVMLETSRRFKTATGKNFEETLNWQPIITKEVEQKAWEEFLPVYLPGKENITVIKGQGEIKSPTSPQFIPIVPQGGDTLKVTYLDSTVRATSDAVQLRYTWSPDSGVVINVPKWSEVKFREPVEVEGFTKHTVELGEGEMEVKVRNNKPAENQFGVDAGWLGVTVSRTHFWVSQSEDKKMAVIGVYEGEVEVKTKDGNTIKVKPDGDPSTGSGQGKPGVVVISQKLSPVKLALAGLVLAAIVGGAILILRKKFTSKVPVKKKK